MTDHKPLTTILGPKRGLPALAAARLRWASLLSTYQYDLEFRSTEKHCNADGLSRLPLDTMEGEVDSLSAFNLSQIDFLPVDTKKLRQATRNDPTLTSRVLMYLRSGWPSSGIDDSLKPLWNRQHELTIESECVMWGMRVVIPTSCQAAVLSELHTAHPGIVNMKSLARVHV